MLIGDPIGSEPHETEGRAESCVHALRHARTSPSIGWPSGVCVQDDHRTMCHLDPGDHAEAIGDPTARAPARQGPSRDARQLGIHKNFKGMKSTPFGTPVTTTHDESTSVTYIRT